MRIRCSRGLKITAHHGNFFIRSTDLLALPNADEDKAFAFPDAVKDFEVVYNVVRSGRSQAASYNLQKDVQRAC